LVFPFFRALANERASRGPAESISQCADYDVDGTPKDSDGDGVPNDGCPLVLNFSYIGGRVLPSGHWVPIPYRCEATSFPLDSAVQALGFLLQDLAALNPNTRFVVIGHSQGGLLAMQSLRWASKVVLEAVVTLDGALGGTPYLETGIADAFSICWGNPAAKDLNRVYESTQNKDKFRQGTTAVFRYPYALNNADRTKTNGELVTQAKSFGTRVMTVGSLDDCVFNTLKCIDLKKFTDNTSSQIVDTANRRWLSSLGGNCIDVLSCIPDSHERVLSNPEVVNEVKIFIGAPTGP
jgi:hypothetical protein